MLWAKNLFGRPKGITPIQSYSIGMGLRPSILFDRDGPGFLGIEGNIPRNLAHIKLSLFQIQGIYIHKSFNHLVAYVIFAKMWIYYYDMFIIAKYT